MPNELELCQICNYPVEQTGNSSIPYGDKCHGYLGTFSTTLTRNEECTVRALARALELITKLEHKLDKLSKLLGEE